MALASGLDQPVQRRLRQLLALLLVLSMGACHIERGGNVSSTPVANDAECRRTNQTLRWDFTQSHDLASVGYPDRCWETRRNIFIEDSTIEVLVAEGLRIGPLDSRRIAVSRNGLEPGLIRDVLIRYGSDSLTAREAYDLVSALAEQYALPRRNIDRWYDKALNDPTRPAQAFTQRYLSDSSTLIITISLSFDKERPYAVFLQVAWPYTVRGDATPTPTDGTE